MLNANYLGKNKDQKKTLRKQLQNFKEEKEAKENGKRKTI